MALPQITGRVQPEIYDRFQSLREKISDPTFSDFMARLLNRYENPQPATEPVGISAEDHENALQLKDNEIGRLETALTLETQRLTAEIDELKTRLSGAKPTEAQALITFPPIVAEVLDIEAATATRKGKGTFTREAILLNCFWETIRDGRYSPYRIWSQSELANIARKLKETANDE